MKHGLLWSAGVLVMVAATGCSTVETSDADGGEPAVGEVVHVRNDRLDGGEEIPETVSEQAWVWEGVGYEEMVVERILPLSEGALLVFDDGVVALDTSTGREAWSYRKVGVSSASAVSPDGSLVAIASPGSMILLDSADGESVREIEDTNFQEGAFVIQDLGLMADDGFVLARLEERKAASVRREDWEDGSRWSSDEITCDGGSSGVVSILGGFFSPTGVVVHLECGMDESMLVSFDPDNGVEDWRLSSGKDFSLPSDHYETLDEVTFAPVGDKAVLQNHARLRGTVIIDTEKGEVLVDDIPALVGDDPVRALEDGYLASRSEKIEEDLWRRHLEVRDFSGEVERSVTVDGYQGHPVTGLLPLNRSLLSLRNDQQEGNARISVFPWGDEGERVVDLDVQVDVSDMFSRWEQDREFGPGTFQEVPGAVLVREYPFDEIPRVAGLS
ncbi:outer membrane protein assembly factor BamB family protein [Nocardiopsis sp. LDBS1602]|uniref:outer membrane protein assembly factor BamB family protein n=1 Tax=Nocardiopsis sp. LDBS1602 TaxID=3109597 RepID=UPI002DBB6DBD|nr:PQQ-binding-like beta-propeller repeat protein [Nocardiopsis sp. LDBS1602]MEC3895372.1 PQQ-binding-like beta-propeller repeat protein [Nocardiopsis sp. LDBS1602]